MVGESIHHSRNNAFGKRAINALPPAHIAPADYKDAWFIQEHAPYCNRTEVPNARDVLNREMSF